MSRRLAASSAFEIDAFEHRRSLTCFGRPGCARRAKRAFNRRVRRLARIEIAAELAD